MHQLQGDEGSEEMSGDHDEAIASIDEFILAWVAFILLSCVLWIARVCGWYDIPWWLIVMPTVLPLGGLDAMCVVAVIQDTLDARRARKA